MFSNKAKLKNLKKQSTNLPTDTKYIKMKIYLYIKV